MALALPPGKKREAFLEKARLADLGAHQWLADSAQASAVQNPLITPTRVLIRPEAVRRVTTRQTCLAGSAAVAAQGQSCPAPRPQVPEAVSDIDGKMKRPPIGGLFPSFLRLNIRRLYA
jgi:hypothetical protein